MIDIHVPPLATHAILEAYLQVLEAREHGLDMDRVAVVTAEQTIEWAFKYLPPLWGPLPSIIAMQPPLTDVETFLLRLIEWTFLVPTYDTALEQANVILRYFLASGYTAGTDAVGDRTDHTWGTRGASDRVFAL